MNASYLRKIGSSAGIGLASLAYAYLVRRRNDRLEPAPVLDGAGHPMPATSFEYSDGERVTVIDTGSGVPILWVPGADGVKETFRYQLPSFSGRYRVVAADLRERFGPHDTFDRFTSDLAEIIDRMATGPVVLVGQSLGSAIAMHLAYRRPELVRGLVLCNPVARVTYEHLGLNRVALVPVARATTRYLPTPFAGLAARLWCRENVWIYDDSPGWRNLVRYALWTGPRTVRSSVSSRRVDLLKGAGLLAELPSIEAPTLVIKGPQDTYCPAAWALEIASLIPGRRYVTVPRGGHCCHISLPGAFNRALGGWLDDLTSCADAERPAGSGEGVTARGNSE